MREARRRGPRVREIGEGEEREEWFGELRLSACIASRQGMGRGEERECQGKGEDYD